MFHLLKIEEIKLVDVDGSVLWQQKDVNNIFHLAGQYFILNACFNTSEGISVPSNYYLGLDNRTTPALSDTLLSLSAEPTQNGYTRQSVSSTNGFTVSTGADGNYKAVSSVVSFVASGGSWGPIKNLFLATSSSSSGYLISTTALDSSHTVQSGQTLTLQVSLGLANC